jgi:hypothetical protein
VTAPEPRSAVRVEVALVLLAGAVLAGVLKWPALHHLRSGVPGGTGDPLLQAWELAWGASALLHGPWHIWDSNTFFPLSQSLAFSDSLVGYAPLGVLFGDGPGAALVRYNTFYLLSYTLAFAGAFLLARQLGTSRAAAALAGLAFAYAPWHLSHDGHLNILSSGGIPLALALLLRGHGLGRSEQQPWRPGLALAGWAVAAWQVTLGFGLGLQFGYLLGVLSLVVLLGWLLARRRGTAASVPRRVALADVAGVALFLTVAATFALPYLQVADEHPESRRTVSDLELFSPPLKGFITTHHNNWLYGDAQKEQRAELGFEGEMALAPGGTLVVLAVTGAVIGAWSVRRRLALVATSLVLLVLAMGTQLAGGRYTYLLLFHHAPGWEGIRTPGRLVVPLTLVLALLAAAGIDRLRLTSGRWGPGVVGFALVLVTAESLGTTETPPPPPLPAALDHVAGPVLVLPSDGFHDTWAMYWSSAGLYPIANGSSGFLPRELEALRQGVAAFPDPASVALLQQTGIRRVVLLLQYAGGSPWEAAAGKPVDGLPVQRSQVGDAVVYEVAPAS